MEYVKVFQIDPIDACLTVMTKPGATPYFKTMAIAYLDVYGVRDPYPLPKVNVSIVLAMQRISSLVAQKTKSQNDLTQRTAELLSSKVCEVSTVALRSVDEDKNVVDMSVKRGFMVTKEDSQMAPIRNHVGGLITYAFQKTKQEDATAAEPNFNVKNTHGIPTLNKTCKIKVNEVHATQAYKTLTSIIEKMATDRVYEMVFNAVASSLVSPMMHGINQGDYHEQTTTKIPVVSKQLPEGIENFVRREQDGKVVARIPKIFMPPVFRNVIDIEAAYRVLGYHRAVRGEDKKFLSPVTSGYYMFSTTTPVVKVLSYVNDIIGVAKLHKCHTIAFASEFKTPVLLSLVANGFPVVQLNPSEHNKLEVEQSGYLKNKVYKLMTLEQLKPPVLIVTNMMQKTRVVVTKTTADYGAFNDDSLLRLYSYGPSHVYATYVHMTPSILKRAEK